MRTASAEARRKEEPLTPAGGVPHAPRNGITKTAHRFTVPSQEHERQEVYTFPPPDWASFCVAKGLRQCGIESGPRALFALRDLADELQA